MNTILLPDMLTAANSKELLRNCKKQLQVGPLCLDGSNLASMDYSADAFFALLALLMMIRYPITRTKHAEIIKNLQQK